MHIAINLMIFYTYTVRPAVRSFFGGLLLALFVTVSLSVSLSQHIVRGAFRPTILPTQPGT